MTSDLGQLSGPGPGVKSWTRGGWRNGGWGSEWVRQELLLLIKMTTKISFRGRYRPDKLR